jgi:hypothetical protein
MSLITLHNLAMQGRHNFMQISMSFILPLCITKYQFIDRQKNN